MESVTLKWSPPELLAGDIQEFFVEVVEMNENATKEVEGSEKKVYYSTKRLVCHLVILIFYSGPFC